MRDIDLKERNKKRKTKRKTKESYHSMNCLGLPVDFAD
jgi:hypothetical protein